MRWIVVGVRSIAALLVLIAVVATYATAVRPVNPFNFFGFFTVQSNLLVAVALALAAVDAARRRASVPLLRAAATTYIALTGLVYNTLLTGVAGGVALPWANTVLHTAIPLYAAADWLLVGDRPALPWRRVWVVVPYPLVWLMVVLIRGATDGWVPYPFLDPANGYGIVAAYCAGITVAVLLTAVLVWAVSRLRLVRLPGRRTSTGPR